MDLTAGTRGLVRLPLGHPEGYIVAFANLYAEFGAAVRGRLDSCADRAALLAPSIDDGVRSMAFIEQAVRSNGTGWSKLPAEY